MPNWVNLRFEIQDENSGIHRVPPAEYVENIRALVRSIQSIGATPVCWVPLRGLWLHKRAPTNFAASEELGIPHFDPQMEAAGEGKATGKRYYFQRDPGHANAAGNQLIAEWVYDYLAEKLWRAVDGIERDSALVLLVFNEIDGLQQVFDRQSIPEFR